ncbi:MAG: shikimate kinase [Chloroflexi bacterium]|nr:shikimate kinase [Chloroflexota bacterium]MYK61854.1 shikimate kinase [Chloroflexota bacterium]
MLRVKPNGNIYLIGFSGTGKSLSGIRAAELLKLPFVDMDDLIEYRTKKSIPEIFEDDGEDEFRKIETDILRELSEKSSRVVSTGGGVPVRELNRQIMRNSGVIIHLTATPETIHKRLTTRQTRNRTLRPLLGDDAPEQRIANLLTERTEAYSCADRSIDTEGLSHRQVAAAIENVWQELSSRSESSQVNSDV